MKFCLLIHCVVHKQGEEYAISEQNSLNFASAVQTLPNLESWCGKYYIKTRAFLILAPSPLRGFDVSSSFIPSHAAWKGFFLLFFPHDALRSHLSMSKSAASMLHLSDDVPFVRRVTNARKNPKKVDWLVGCTEERSEKKVCKTWLSRTLAGPGKKGKQ